MRNSPFSAAVAGFLGGLAAAVAIIGLSSASGVFDSTTTVVQQSPAPASVSESPVATTLPSGTFDPEAVYRSRIGGVVTITSVLSGSEEISGSGFVVSRAGMVLTNAHVVTNSGESGVASSSVHPATRVYVMFANGDQVEATVVGYDLFDDVALVRVTDPAIAFQPVPLGDSEKVVVGEPVAAIGSPFSQAGSLSVGVVSAVDRSIPSFVTRYSIPGAIQTDAAINHGNSGGPLFNARGQVIGINAQINSTSGGGEGVGFAVPIDSARRSMRQLEASGRVSYGWLGVRASTVTEAIAREFKLPVRRGALVQDVSPGGPAADGGIRGGLHDETFQDQPIKPDGDIIVGVDSASVTSADELVKVMARYAAGARVAVRLWHGSEQRTVHVTLGERPLDSTQ
jgi:2-alkenal reductase